MNNLIGVPTPDGDVVWVSDFSTALEYQEAYWPDYSKTKFRPGDKVRISDSFQFPPMTASEMRKYVNTEFVIQCGVLTPLNENPMHCSWDIDDPFGYIFGDNDLELV